VDVITVPVVLSITAPQPVRVKKFLREIPSGFNLGITTLLAYLNLLNNSESKTFNILSDMPPSAYRAFA
jgi:hypothetical protein